MKETKQAADIKTPTAEVTTTPIPDRERRELRIRSGIRSGVGASY